MKQTKTYLLYLGVSMFAGPILIAITLAKPQSPTTQQPTVVSATAPIFPPLANAARVSADVIVEVKIDATGVVTSVHAEGHALLRGVSEAAAKRWKFAPAETNVGTRTTRITFSFRPLEKELPADQTTPVFYPPYRIEVVHNPNILQKLQQVEENQKPPTQG